MIDFRLDKEKRTLKFYGMYRGIVEDVEDPLEAGRVKVRVYSVYDDVPKDALPWAQFADPLMGCQENIGSFIVPDLESHVWVFFDQGDFMQPIYFAGVTSVPAMIEERLESSHWETRGNPEYPRNKVFRTKAGHVIELDDTPGNTKVRVKHKSGSETIMFDNGDISEHVIGNYYQLVEGDSYIHIKGNEKVLVEGNSETRIVGNRDRHIEGHYKSLVNGDETRQVDGNLDSLVYGDETTEIKGLSAKFVLGEMGIYSFETMNVYSMESLTLSSIGDDLNLVAKDVTVNAIEPPEMPEPD